ncbi:ABC transporter permease [Yimella sp. cx-51]|uniref:ABC transporter permease n=1 Tax=Yimella sp. cx-51 TaxID=2770551 RepID=UPI001AD86E0A|nr:ABC transporter permease [Yimella sp. cx-51]QTH38102.1 ABC transporter permease [Yimella sp. cx-51]
MSVDTNRESSVKMEQPGPRLGALKTWTIQELRLLIREPVAVFFSLIFPLVIFLFIGMPYADEIIDKGKNLRLIDAMFPSLVGTVAANLLLMGLPIYIAELRNKEVDKRYRTLPLPGWIFASAVVLSMLVLVVAAASVIVAAVGFSSGLRSEVYSPQFLLLGVGFVAMLCPIGLFLGTLPFPPRTIQAVTAGVFFILFFGSGAAAPIDGMPQVVQSVLEWNPLKIWFDALVDVYVSAGIKTSSILKILLTYAVSVVALLCGLRNWKRVS